jgi:MFS family permease
MASPTSNDKMPSPSEKAIPANTTTAAPSPLHSDIENDSSTTTSKDTDSSRRTGSIITIIGSALANLSDGYQQNLASSTNVVFDHVLPKHTYTSSIQTRISNSLLVGSVIGIVVFGYLADKFSRKGGMLVTSGLVVVGSLMATLVFQVGYGPAGGVAGMMWYVTIARGATGVGVGGESAPFHYCYPNPVDAVPLGMLADPIRYAGEYPTSSAAALESSNEHFDKNRGPIQVLISTLMATSGGPICTFVYLMALIGSGNDLKVAYHVMYAVSIFLPMLVVLVRWRMQDGKLFERSNFKRRNFPWGVFFQRYWGRIMGTTAAFFLYDFVNL